MGRFDIGLDEPQEKPKERAYPVPWSVIERSANGDFDAQKIIAPCLAKKLVEERDMAYRATESQII